jgi:uncharacterized membrane protein YgcG
MVCMRAYATFPSVTMSVIAVVMVCSQVPSEARANQIEPADCNLDFTTSYNPGDQVCVTGDVDGVPPGEICGGAYVFVFPAGGPDPFFDITNPQHVPNYITTCLGGGAFIDESVWLPPTIPGQYGLLLDEYPFGGSVGAEDVLNDFAFTVTNAPIVFSVNPALIKADAVKGLAAANALYNLAVLLSALDAASTAADWAIAFGTGGGLAGLVFGVYCVTNTADLHSGYCPPTSYNSAVLSIGGTIMKGMSAALTKHYDGIIADPPDPNFLVVVPAKTEDVLALGGPWTPLADHPMPNAQTRVASLLGLQAGAYQALLPTLEKAQGAQLASDHLGLVLQSEKLKAHAQLALDAGAAINTELDALQAHLSSTGQLGIRADLAAIQGQIDAGLSDAQRAQLHSYGLDDAQIEQALGELKTTPMPAEVSWDALIVQTRAVVDEMRPSLEDLVAQAEAVRAENAPYALRIRPVASLAGPPTGSVGAALTLTASATHENPAATLSYAWDTDGDGDYDDGTGASLAFTPPAPGLTLVTVEVSDGAYQDYATHLVDVAVSNVPPALENLTPADMAPFADVGQVVAFHAEASDADGDPITLKWIVDDVEQGTGNDFELTMPDEEPHSVVVLASDDDPYSPDAGAAFLARASKWKGEITGAGGGGGSGSGSGSGGSGSGGDDGDDGSSDDGCGCITAGTAGGSMAPCLALVALGVALQRRRRRSP